MTFDKRAERMKHPQLPVLGFCLLAGEEKCQDHAHAALQISKTCLWELAPCRGLPSFSILFCVLGSIPMILGRRASRSREQRWNP